MRILVNGYYYGGNCPPFVQALKSINPDLKLTNALSILDEHGINHDHLTQADIIDLKLNFIEKQIVFLLKKARLLFWKTILVRKAKKLVAEYKPDIIINHKASEKAEIMLKTGFRPQVTYIYGGEVHGDRVLHPALDYIFAESSFILTTTEQMRLHLCAKRNSLRDKTRVFPLGYFGLERIQEYKKSASWKEIRRKYGFSEDEAVFFDNRSLRGSHAGFEVIIKALRELRDRGLSFKMIFLKGFLGTDSMVKRLRGVMNGDPSLAGHIVFNEGIVSDEQILDYYFLADAFISLLPADQCGKCINDAVFLDCSLILSDLEVYRSRLGNGPCYIQGKDAVQLASALAKIIAGGKCRVENEVHDNLREISQPHLRFEKLFDFIKEVVRAHALD